MPERSDGPVARVVPAASRNASSRSSSADRSGSCTGTSAGSVAPDADEAHHLPRVATEVVGEHEPALDGVDLAVVGRLAAQLEPALEQHPQAGRTHGVAEG